MPWLPCGWHRTIGLFVSGEADLLATLEFTPHRVGGVLRSFRNIPDHL
jgi:hypothetical protein